MINPDERNKAHCVPINTESCIKRHRVTKSLVHSPLSCISPEECQQLTFNAFLISVVKVEVLTF